MEGVDCGFGLVAVAMSIHAFISVVLLEIRISQKKVANLFFVGKITHLFGAIFCDVRAFVARSYYHSILYKFCPLQN